MLSTLQKHNANIRGILLSPPPFFFCVCAKKTNVSKNKFPNICQLFKYIFEMF